MNLVKSAFVGFAACAAIAAFGVPSPANAIWSHPAPATATDQIASPPNITDSWYASVANTDVGSMSLANVTSVVQTQTGLSVSSGTQVFTFGGSGSGPLTGTFSLAAGLASALWAIHFDNQFLILAFDAAVNSITVLLPGLLSDHPQGISGVYAFNISQVPLPPALLLFGTALAGMTILGRRRRSKTA